MKKYLIIRQLRQIIYSRAREKHGNYKILVLTATRNTHENNKNL